MKKLLVTLGLFFLCGSLWAHPHVWVDYSVKVVFDANGLSGFEHRWIFDDIFGTSIIADYDSNQDGSFSTAEISAIETDAFSNLKNYNYFNLIEIDGNTVSGVETEDFSAEIFNGKLVYTFFVPCSVTATSSKKTISLWVYDESYFVDFSFQYLDEDLNGSSVDADVEIEIDTDSLSTFGQFFPRKITVDLKK